MLSRKGKENVHALHEELADTMVSHCTVVRSNGGLQEALLKIEEIRDRFAHIHLGDTGHHVNQTLQFALQFGPMLDVAETIARGALARNEFRGSHYKPEFPERDDEQFLKTTLATHTKGGIKISYLPVDIRHLSPLKRDYTTAKRVKPELHNVPKQIPIVTERDYGRG